MQTEYLIIGSGIAGMLLSYELIQVGKNVIVIDDLSLPKASTVAGAILNPVNIKQWSVAKDYQLYIQKALDTYTAVEQFLNVQVICEKSIITFDHKEAAKPAATEFYLTEINEKNKEGLYTFFNHTSSLHKITPVYQIHATTLLEGWRKYLSDKNIFFDELFQPKHLSFPDKKIEYKNITAKKIIFCEGAYGIQNPFFPNLPFTKNRGDALLLSIPRLPDSAIYHNEIRLIPTGNELFWCGSNYTWNYTNLYPDVDWRKKTESFLGKWLKLSFNIREHIVAERPTTAGQQSLMLMHDSLPAALFNGLGTKGFLMAPFLAKQFVQKIIVV